MLLSPFLYPPKPMEHWYKAQDLRDRVVYHPLAHQHEHTNIMLDGNDVTKRCAHKTQDKRTHTHITRRVRWTFKLFMKSTNIYSVYIPKCIFHVFQHLLEDKLPCNAVESFTQCRLGIDAVVVKSSLEFISVYSIFPSACYTAQPASASLTRICSDDKRGLSFRLMLSRICILHEILLMKQIPNTLWNL